MSNVLDSGSWILGLSALLLAAAFAGFACRRVGLPAAIGYLVVGVVVGPFTPGYIAEPSQIAFLNLAGSTLLLFVLGLAIDVKAILRQPSGLLVMPLLYHGIGTGVGSVALTALGVAPLAATTIALATVVSSSVAAGDLSTPRLGRDGPRASNGVRAWSELGAAAGVVSAIALTALLTTAPIDGARLLGGPVAFVLLALLLRMGVRTIDRMAVADSSTRFLLQSGIVVTAVGAGALLLETAVPLAAFLVGVVLGDSRILVPGHRRGQFRGLFVLMFFVAAGAVLDPAAVSRNVAWLGPITLLIACKLLLAFTLLRLYRLRLDLRLLAARLGPIGEVGVLILGIGAGVGVLSHDERSVLLTVAVLSIALFGYVRQSTVYRLSAASGGGRAL